MILMKKMTMMLMMTLMKKDKLSIKETINHRSMPKRDSTAQIVVLYYSRMKMAHQLVQKKIPNHQPMKPGIIDCKC